MQLAGNIGDSLQYLSDDRLKSTYHRVRTPRPDEYMVRPSQHLSMSCCREIEAVPAPMQRHADVVSSICGLYFGFLDTTQ